MKSPRSGCKVPRNPRTHFCDSGIEVAEHSFWIAVTTAEYFPRAHVDVIACSRQNCCGNQHLQAHRTKIRSCPNEPLGKVVNLLHKLKQQGGGCDLSSKTCKQTASAATISKLQ